MKICFIINSLKQKSGSERVAIELANQISRIQNHSITIINRESIKDDTAYPLNSSIQLIAFKGNMLNFFKQLHQHLMINDYDVTIVHNMGKLALMCSFLKANKLITLEHVAFTSRPKTVQIASKLLYSNYQKVITLTQNDQGIFEHFHNNVVTIPNFSSFPIQPTQNNSKVIIAIGRLTDQKNFTHLLQAWKLIQKQIPEWQLHIYGEGEEKQLLQNYINTHELTNVALKGETTSVNDVYSHAAFFVMSSKYEGLPMVLIEAQSFGLPIISYNCPFGPADIISDNKNGFLVENQNPNKLGDTILKLATSPDLLNNFSKQALINAEKYQPTRIINIWINEVFN